MNMNKEHRAERRALTKRLAALAREEKTGRRNRVRAMHRLEADYKKALHAIARDGRKDDGGRRKEIAAIEKRIAILNGKVSS